MQRKPPRWRRSVLSVGTDGPPGRRSTQQVLIQHASRFATQWVHDSAALLRLDQTRKERHPLRVASLPQLRPGRCRPKPKRIRRGASVRRHRTSGRDEYSIATSGGCRCWGKLSGPASAGPRVRGKQPRGNHRWGPAISLPATGNGIARTPARNHDIDRRRLPAPPQIYRGVRGAPLNHVIVRGDRGRADLQTRDALKWSTRPSFRPSRSSTVP
jgi:hypothetical protein